MIHPSTEVRYINEEKGYGLFATRDIPTGTITWVKDRLDREIRPEELERYEDEIREVIIHYSYRNNRGNYIFCWDNARYMNHDSTPNTSITPYEVELAIRDIQKGEEITNHYGMLNIIEPFTLPDGSGTVIHPDDMLSYGPQWDAQLMQAFPQLTRVEQPLRRFVPESRWAELKEVSSGEISMKSVVECHFPGTKAAC